MDRRWSKMVGRVVLSGLLLCSVGVAQSGMIEAGARKGIAAGNQAWIDGMKQGNAAVIGATYAEGALNCGPTGECARGRAAIEQRSRNLFDKRGKARSASVASDGSVQQGDFIYEWGRAEAAMADGTKVEGKYLTVWQRQADGSWKIFRNMVIPQSATH